MAWLVAGDRVLASLEIPAGRRGRAKGLIGRDKTAGAMLIRPCRSVHTLGMRFPIDVAFVGEDGVVLAIVTMKPRRIGRPRFKASFVVEAGVGAFERWGLTVGTEVEVRQ